MTSINLFNQQLANQSANTIPEFDANTNQYVVVVPSEAMSVNQAIQPELSVIGQGTQTTIQQSSIPQTSLSGRVEGIESSKLESLSNKDVIKLQRNTTREISSGDGRNQQDLTVSQQISNVLQNSDAFDLSNREINKVTRLQGRLEGVTSKIDGSSREIELIQEAISSQGIARRGQLAKLDRLNARVEKLNQQSNEIIDSISNVIGQGVDRTGKEILRKRSLYQVCKLGISVEAKVGWIRTWPTLPF